MKLYSTNNNQNIVSFRHAIEQGIAEDGGLFMPVEIPKPESTFFQEISHYSFNEIAFYILRAFLNDEIPDNDLENLVSKTFTFNAPLVKLAGGPNILELFHGPTLAFKDFGARFMANTLSYFIKNENKELTILVATSGDTGSAVANGFYNVDGIKVIILYPSKKVSNIQEKQLTTLGNNISALEIEGTFDDCQRLVRQAFTDSSLKEKLRLSSANSINFARLLPQSFYYYSAYARLEDKTKPFIVSVPSGNFGNLTAGLIAKKTGLPVDMFIAATNVNDIVPEYLETGSYNPRTSVQTISNAMDVGNPSNFARIMALFSNRHDIVRENIYGASFSDELTREAIKEVREKYNYIIDPHGAVGYLAIKKFTDGNFEKFNTAVLETAHPAKFIDVMEDVLNEKLIIPERLAECLNKEKHSVRLSSKYDEFRSYLYAL
ncbi:MAG: threonine synthase [Ignavibacteria bacterium]